LDRTNQIVEVGTRAIKVGATASISSPFVNWAVDNSEIISLSLGVGGFIVGVAGIGIQWYYLHKRHQQLLKQSTDETPEKRDDDV